MPGPNSELPATPDGWAFFLDLDGTLVEIAAMPDGIVVPPDLPDVLTRLCERTSGACAVVTGRTIGTIDRVLAPAHLPVAGIHGAELRFPDGHQVETVAPDALEPARIAFNDLVEVHPDLFLEDKHVALTLHYRAVPELGDLANATARDAVAVSGGALALQLGKMVAEVRPAEADKGRAVEAFMKHGAFAGRRPVAVGDDLTDEHMFEVARDLGGLAVRVGGEERESAATLGLADPAACRKWLKAVAESRK